MTKGPETGLNPLGFIIKVLVSSTMIAIALKTVGPYLPLTATAATSLVIVLAPSLLIGSFLGWQLWTSRPTHAADPKRD